MIRYTKLRILFIAGGIRAIEVTFNTPGAAKMIEKLVEKYNDQVLIGAGTVLDAETARIAILSRASFLYYHLL